MASAIARSETGTIRSTTRSRSATASGIATRTARPSAKVAILPHSTARPAFQESAITGASFATTPMTSVPGERRSSVRPMPPMSAPLPTGTTTADGGSAIASTISSAMMP